MSSTARWLRCQTATLFQLLGAQDFEIDRIIQIVAVICDLVREIRDLRFQRRASIFFLSRSRRIVKRLVLLQSLPHFEGQIQPGKIRIGIFEQLHHAQALLVVLEPAVLAHAFRQHLLAGMPERRMPQVVRQRDRFGQILVERKRARDRAADRGDFDRMRQPRAQMIAGPIEENLRLVFEPAKGPRMNDPRAIALKLRAIGVARLRIFSAPGFA